jgi:hypothetical protein
MHLSNQGLLVILVVGVIAGWLAGKIVKGHGLGLVRTRKPLTLGHRRGTYCSRVRAQEIFTNPDRNRTHSY